MCSKIDKKIVKQFVEKYGEDFYNYINNSNLEPKFSQKKEGGRITRPSNSYFQFKPVVSKYASDKNLSLIYKGELIILSSNQGYLAKVAAELWKELPEVQKNKFRRLYELAKDRLQREHPDYKYSPNRSKAKFKANCQKKKPKKADRNINVINNTFTHDNNINQQMNVEVPFQPVMFPVSSPDFQNCVNDYFPPLDYNQNQLVWNSNSPILPSSSSSPLSDASREFPFTVTVSNIPLDTFYPVSNDLTDNDILFSVPDISSDFDFGGFY
ncbi:hypothetical protein C1645_807522 [Glomus cerebriforme]|uniref:HMG box domain-containing protein n=1 Tax=Glomus cerebriforme TaxID=658196 RepID=A0A397SVS6_9GLOM|nr:hypothetical protein C1645_807522 [Glomus cerebriforme]